MSITGTIPGDCAVSPTASSSHSLPGFITTRSAAPGNIAPSTIVLGRLAILFAVLAALGSVGVWGAATVSAATDKAIVTELVKPVQILRKGSRNWTFLKLKDEVAEGDHVRTGNGARVELTFAKGRVVRIGQRSEIEIPRLRNARNLFNVKFGLLAGRLWGNMLRKLNLDRGDFLTVSTPTATVGVKGTQFGVDNDIETKTVQVTVFKGIVAALPPGSDPGAPQEIPGPREIAPPQEITREEWEIIVRAEQKLIFRPGQDPQLVAIEDKDLEDPWVVYNREKDEAMEQALGATQSQ